MNRICRHARKITERYQASSPTPLSDVPPHVIGDDERMRYAGWERVVDIDDSPENWQCGWSLGNMPPPIERWAGTNALRHGDCDLCRFFEAVDVAIPGVR